MLEQVENLLRQAGAELMEWRQWGMDRGRWEGDQLKTLADENMHRRLKAGLAEIAPDLPCVSEEDAVSQTGERPDYYWLIDPIDGTRSFVEGFPGFVTQVAMMRHGTPVEAAVFCPPLDLLYTARRGAGAALNGSRLSLDQTPGLTKLIDNYPQPRGIAAAVMEAFGIPNYVESGSIGLKICRIADGTADLFVKDVVVRDWDVAPGQLILQEAGGVLTELEGRQFSYEGGFAKHGLIATRTRPDADQLTAWGRHRT